MARTKGARDKQARRKRLVHGAIAIGSLGAATVLGAKVIKDYGAAKAARKAVENAPSGIPPKLTRDQMDDLVNEKLKGTLLAPVPKRLSTGANKGLTKQQRSELVKRRRNLMQGLLEKDSNSVLGKSSSLDVTRKPARGSSKITPKADRKYRATMAKQAGYRARRSYGSDYSSSAFLSDYQAEFARTKGARDKTKRKKVIGKLAVAARNGAIIGGGASLLLARKPGLNRLGMLKRIGAGAGIGAVSSAGLNAVNQVAIANAPKPKWDRKRK